MLIGRRASVRRRVANVLLAAVAACVPAAGWAAGAAAGWWDWPRATSRFGVAAGFAGGLIVLFEMLLWPRKWLRGRRLGATRAWMRLHIWLGLLGLPVVVLHTGFGLGGSLPAATLVLFLVVIASGVYGLVLQQWLPAKLLADVPGETVASQVGRASAALATEAAGLAVGPLAAFREKELDPYLRHGRRSGSPLRDRGRAGQRFGELRPTLPADLRPALARLEELADLRRRWDAQLSIHWHLHAWLLVHLPVSVAMTLFMCVHAVVALKLW